MSSVKKKSIRFSITSWKMMSSVWTSVELNTSMTSFCSRPWSRDESNKTMHLTADSKNRHIISASGPEPFSRASVRAIVLKPNNKFRKRKRASEKTNLCQSCYALA